ncbi:NTP/NDP exchange transporter [Campylobacter troglodytis]|uniref:NTP/NDP exchange transporter n=1 Tax=Campylobacter troglodytis TaxID=654363 RepID=UPI00115ADA03|nr:MFS transporter [Campylobacter troglodytis]TQR60837.1 MFS transporter [Campylobacter troglodytis]
MMAIHSFLYKLFSLKEGEFKLLILSFGFIFVLFSSYSLLRPIRDALGLTGGQDELKWLFLATFISCILSSLFLMWFATRIKRRFYMDGVLVFFGLNLLCFYLAMRGIDAKSDGFIWLCRIFYVWVSVFNLFTFSSAWSVIADLFNKEASKRLFGIIAAGASLGSIAGAGCVAFLVKFLGVNNIIFISMLLLFIALLLKNLMIKELKNFESDLSRFDKTIGAKNPFVGFSLIIKSPYLLALCAFILLLTSVSTFLYMEQARIIREFFPTREARIAAFANIDLTVQISALIIQIFLTAQIAKFFKLTALLGTLGFVVCVGFVVLAFTHPAFIPLAVVMSVRRVGEYALVKPGREMLYVPLSSDEKYKAKSFIDTVVYRGGDALSAQLESLLANISIMLVLLCGALISFVWGLLGVFLGRRYER